MPPADSLSIYLSLYIVFYGVNNTLLFLVSEKSEWD